MTSPNPYRYLAPADVAAKLCVKVDAVLGWIKSGELRAIDVARSRNRKLPRWRISPADLEAFEEVRAAKPRGQPPPRPRRQRASDTIDFF